MVTFFWAVILCIVNTHLLAYFCTSNNPGVDFLTVHILQRERLRLSKAKSFARGHPGTGTQTLKSVWLQSLSPLSQDSDASLMALRRPIPRCYSCNTSELGNQDRCSPGCSWPKSKHEEAFVPPSSTLGDGCFTSRLDTSQVEHWASLGSRSYFLEGAVNGRLLPHPSKFVLPDNLVFQGKTHLKGKGVDW